MELADLVTQIEGFDQAAPRDKIQLFAWFLHTHRNKEVFISADIRACFSSLHLADPNVPKYLARMLEYGEIIKVRDGFKLERTVRIALDGKLGMHQTVIQVSKLLADLPGKVPDIAEKNFLAEAIKCYRVEAYRACVIMTWNLAYSHLVHWILRDVGRLTQFNSSIAVRYPKKSAMRITNYDDLQEHLKESEVIEICNTASLLNGNIIRILKEKLGRRNAAAHPSSVVIVQSQADDVVTDLVNNLVLSLQ
jgi:hypothetical protein